MSDSIQQVPSLVETGTPDVLQQKGNGWSPFFSTPVSQNPVFSGTSYASYTPGPMASSASGWFLTGVPAQIENEAAPDSVGNQESEQTQQSNHPFIDTSKLETDGAVPDSYYTAIASHESGGSDTARNPTSSALGRYQFLSGTWNGLMKTHPELGLTPQGRTDPAQEDLAIRAFTEDNAKTLRQSGIGINGGSLYAAHFLGAGEASKVLKAPNTQAVADIVPSSVVKANSFLRHMDVGQFKLWAAKAGGFNPSS